MGAMTDRLRTSAARIKDAERRASMGELARQVNHDIKNGLTPIRNVLRHLSQLAASDPEQMPAVYRERQDTLDAGIAYLDNLATNYARLSPRSDRRPCDVNEIIRRAVKDLGGAGGPKLRTALARRAVVQGDPVALRRILDNLLGNAVDSLPTEQARVTVSTERVTGGDGRRLVRIAVADEGVGMDAEQVARIFDDFYTTKPDGTGLGLSIVRRLVMDLDGAIRVESEPGKGSRFEVDLPEAP
jgi:signal transduction histidine kinase